MADFSRKLTNTERKYTTFIHKILAIFLTLNITFTTTSRASNSHFYDHKLLTSMLLIDHPVRLITCYYSMSVPPTCAMSVEKTILLPTLSLGLTFLLSSSPQLIIINWLPMRSSETKSLSKMLSSQSSLREHLD